MSAVVMKQGGLDYSRTEIVVNYCEGDTMQQMQ